MSTYKCFGAHIWADSFDTALSTLIEFCKSKQAGYACFANAHMVGEAGRDLPLARALSSANWVFADGHPVARYVRWCTSSRAEQVAGPEMTRRLLTAAACNRLPVFFLGGDPAMLDRLLDATSKDYPGLIIAGSFSPPFGTRPLEAERAEAYRVKEAGAAICFVALGCPKQEVWMSRHAETTGALCLGVGAAFAMISGDVPRAPAWIRQVGLEWLYRWMQEPRRLTGRYTVGNLRFGRALLRELVTRRHGLA